MAGETTITIVGNRRCAAQDPDPLYADAVSVSRFWRLVDVRAETECWPWHGHPWSPVERERTVTEQDVVLIRERRAAGARQIDLAEQFGLTEGAVSMIVRGVRWPHAGGPIQTERKYIRG